MPPVEEILQENARLKAELSGRDSIIAGKSERIAELEAQIAWFRRQIFAGGKSEKVDPGQLGFLEDLLREAKESEDGRPKEKISYERGKPKGRRKRDELYGNLPVDEEVVIDPEEVLADPASYERCGEVETFEVKIRPPVFSRRRIVRRKYRKTGDRSEAPLVAPAPARPVEGIASAELLSHIAVSKYLDHLPLYRQCAIYKRHGFPIPRQNLVRWVEKVAEWLKPIYNHMRLELLEGDYVQADETPIKYLDPDYGERKARTGYLCGLTRPGGNVWYKWSLGRSHASVSSHLEGFEGVVQADMYDAYPKLEKASESVELAACWAHARRKFFEIRDRNRRECDLILKLIGKLYAVEKAIRERRGNEDRFDDAAAKAYRQEKAANTHSRLNRVLRIVRHGKLPKQELATACDYALNHWGYLSTYLEHGRVEIDNNGMENAIRPTAVGKKNWLFVGHPQAGERSAILYSILISCQRLGIHPQDYLTEMLKTDLSRLDRRKLSELTPSAWAKSRGSI